MPPDTLGIRDYRACDADTTLALFQRAVREVAARDYTPKQIDRQMISIPAVIYH